MFVFLLSYLLPNAPVFSLSSKKKNLWQKQHFSLSSLVICAQSLPQPSQCLRHTAKYPALEKRREYTLKRQNRRSFCRLCAACQRLR